MIRCGRVFMVMKCRLLNRPEVCSICLTSGGFMLAFVNAVDLPRFGPWYGGVDEEILDFGYQRVEWLRRPEGVSGLGKDKDAADIWFVGFWSNILGLGLYHYRQV